MNEENPIGSAITSFEGITYIFECELISPEDDPRPRFGRPERNPIENLTSEEAIHNESKEKK